MSVSMNWKDTQMVDRYVIDSETMAVLPLLERDRVCSHVIGYYKHIYTSVRPTQLIDRSCRYYGSSFQGRKTGTKELIGITHKPPIVIDASNSIYFFPTTSPAKPQCAWLSHSHISTFKKANHDQTIVTFLNGESVTLDISYSSFSNQFYRTAQLRTVVSSRIEEEQRKLNLLLFPDGQKSILYEQIVREFRRGMK